MSQERLYRENQESRVFNNKCVVGCKIEDARATAVLLDTGVHFVGFQLFFYKLFTCISSITSFLDSWG